MSGASVGAAHEASAAPTIASRPLLLVAALAAGPSGPVSEIGRARAEAAGHDVAPSTVVCRVFIVTIFITVQRIIPIVA